ncbi:hypothetical protein LHJ74_25390 [Streptomyces sp. N2-109]|uniref:Uncharacterized protein n=1 Tax=Streptomyces gossypii TaxID=2883101 RepID=A0ABT2K0Z2_9ACTN|nr:hypothetical protein [Streptomyces gossypii]MCT2593200.1 hypothetical protein [Streptomyces gossypii]
MTDDELRGRLRGAARAHRPDRERMLARVERGMAESENPPLPPRPAAKPVTSWLRVVSATAAVAGVCAVGGYAVASAARDEEPRPQSVARGSAPEATAEAPSVTPGSQSVPVGDLLWADGSVDPGSTVHWAQSNITVKVKKPLTALTVELRVAQNGKVADTGNWRSLPAEDFDVSAGEASGVLVYRWTLKDGLTVPPGEYVFAGQYNHAEGQRDAGDDSYAVEAAPAVTPGERAEWRGDFARSSP